MQKVFPDVRLPYVLCCLQRFHRRLYRHEDGCNSDDEDDMDWQASDASDDEEGRDKNFRPLHHFWANKGVLPSLMMHKGMKSRQAANVQLLKSRQDGASLLGLGAPRVPQALRELHNSPYAQAQARLSLAAVPSELPCRDEEKAKVRAFVEEALSGGARRPALVHEQALHACIYTRLLLTALGADGQ